MIFTVTYKSCTSLGHAREVAEGLILAWRGEASLLLRIPILVDKCTSFLPELSAAREFELRLNVLVQISFRRVLSSARVTKACRLETVCCLFESIRRLVGQSRIHLRGSSKVHRVEVIARSRQLLRLLQVQHKWVIQWSH